MRGSSTSPTGSTPTGATCVSTSRSSEAYTLAPVRRLREQRAGISLNKILDRITDFRISGEYHGPADARRYTYEPTFIMRGLSDLHIEFTPIK